ncbi:efflux transporter outer membrane subunit [Pseudoduganella sp. FT26W]|uniref:Efflux transporter outer membrane subunit n=1 Tax=Duganella aquatilis TaxID=2666082 RepID=A0A844D621_9BURK|nr:efflux transporter outer membrane subunit [Duganella aquatilis]MRW87528.1 efflux transporter outer membrane subunit [Duganella aquatilis]
MTIIQKISRSSVLIAMLLAGCSLAPTYERPISPVAEAWPAAVAMQKKEEGTAPHDLPWQDFFKDEQLKQLIGVALERNRDLRVATLNIERTRSLYQVQSADRLPNINLGLSGSRQQVPDLVAPGGHGGTFTSYTAGLGLSAFELDLFGRVRNLSGAALERFAATQEGQRAAQISLVAQVAYSYEAVLADEHLLALSRQTLSSRDASHQRQIELRASGATSDYDLRQSESLLAAAKVAVLQAQRQRALDENALVVLIGGAVPAALLPDVNKTWDSEAISALPAGLPSDLLNSRPDIRQQEALLRAANANIGAARAAFFPRISLTSAFGSSSNELSGLFDSGSRAWSFQPLISLPIFDGGRNSANLGVALADRDIAVAQYEKTVQIAFREVADALAGHATLYDELRAVKAQEHAEHVRHDLAKLRYESGEASYLEYLDAQRTLFAAQQQTIRTSLTELQNRITLYKSLGGGWSTPPQ